jgi:hypothetical protein
MEGKFDDEGLQSIDEDDDMLSAMARKLVERNGIGETADAVWKALNLEHQKLFPTIAHDNLDVSPTELTSDLTEDMFDPVGMVEEPKDSGSVLVFGQRAEALSSGRRRRSRPVAPEQASLFSFN